MRYTALYPHDTITVTKLSIAHYCVLELIGRSRFSGQTTSGMWSLNDFCDDPSLIFYIM